MLSHCVKFIKSYEMSDIWKYLQKPCFDYMFDDTFLVLFAHVTNPPVTCLPSVFTFVTVLSLGQ